MANEKYDNLMAMLGSGKLNWVGDKIDAYLFTGSSFTKSQQRLSEVPGARITSTPVPGRSVGPAGSLCGLPASFQAAEADQPYEVVIVKDDGTGDPWLLAYYDSDPDDAPIQIANAGSMMIRPVQIPDATPPTLGVWVQF